VILDPADSLDGRARAPERAGEDRRIDLTVRQTSELGGPIV